MRNNPSLLLPAFMLFALPLANAQADAAPRALPMCSASQLSLGTDDENGNFNGMSHSGTLLVVRNLGSTACRVDAIPQITFADATHHLPAKGTMPGAKFMHPGPVVLPVVVAAGAELTASLRWVSGQVYDKSTCIEPTKVTVRLGDGTQSAPLRAHLCGDAANGGVTFEMTRFAPDPVYRPGIAAPAPPASQKQ